MTSRQSTFKNELVCLLPRMWRFGLSLTGSTAACDDLVQATCERALVRFGQWRSGSRLDSWVFTIMHSIWKNELRAESIRRGAGFVDPDNSGIMDDRLDVDMTAYAHQVYQAVCRLPEAQRSLILLVYVEGYSYKEAAEIMDVPIGTVMSRLARGRMALVELLAESGSNADRRRNPSN